MQFLQPGNSLVQVDEQQDPAPPAMERSIITIYRWLHKLHISIKDTGINRITPSSFKNCQ